MLQPSREVDPCKAVSGGLHVSRAAFLVSVELIEESAQEPQLAFGAALELAPTPRDLARLLEVAVTKRVRQPLDALAVRAEADHDEPRIRHRLRDERPGCDEQVDSLGDDQLADEADNPVALRVEHPQRIRSAGLATPTRGVRALEPVSERPQSCGGVGTRDELVGVDAGGSQAR